MDLKKDISWPPADLETLYQKMKDGKWWAFGPQEAGCSEVCRGRLKRWLEQSNIGTMERKTIALSNRNYIYRLIFNDDS